MEAMEWVERLGGWGVVLLVVRWMMSRHDKMTEALTDSNRALTDSVAAYGEFQRTNDDAHRQIVHTLEEIRDAVRLR